MNGQKNGVFSVKGAYKMLEQLQPLIRGMISPKEKQVWKKIWKTPGVLPRVRIFFWKILEKALPIGVALSKRIPTFQPSCSICNANMEDAAHALFLCLHARATWFVSGLGLRTSLVQHESMVDCLWHLWEILDTSQIAFFMMLAWHI